MNYGYWLESQLGWHFAMSLFAHAASIRTLPVHDVFTRVTWQIVPASQSANCNNSAQRMICISDNKTRHTVCFISFYNINIQWIPSISQLVLDYNFLRSLITQSCLCCFIATIFKGLVIKTRKQLKWLKCSILFGLINSKQKMELLAKKKHVIETEKWHLWSFSICFFLLSEGPTHPSTLSSSCSGKWMKTVYI